MTFTYACCDDEQITHELLEKLRLQFIIKYDHELAAHYYKSGAALLDAYKAGMKFDFLFMDIEMPAENGLDVAELVRTLYDRDVIIVFLTSYPQYMKSSFRVRAFDYLNKPLNFDDYEDIMLRIAKDISDSCITLSLIQKEGEELLIKTDDLMYVETCSGLFSEYRLLFHMKDGTVHKVRGSIRVWADNLAKFNFVNPHRSFIVNLLHIYRFIDNEIELHDGTRIPLSRYKASEIRSMFSRFSLALGKKR